MLNNVRLVVDFSTAKYERFYYHFCTSVNNFKDFQNLYPTQEVGKHEKSSKINTIQSDLSLEFLVSLC